MNRLTSLLDDDIKSCNVTSLVRVSPVNPKTEQRISKRLLRMSNLIESTY